MRAFPITLVAVTLACAAPAWAGHGKGKGSKAEEAPAVEDSSHDRHHGDKGFSDREASEIRGYFRAHPDARNQLPPGLAKKNKVPPGWRKKLGIGERIPDDVWAHHVPLPREVNSKLPELESGVIRVRIDDRVLRVAEKTREVLDVLGLPSPLDSRSGPPR